MTATAPPTQARQWPLLIDGQDVTGQEQFTRLSPAHDVEVGVYQVADEAAIDAAVAAAHREFDGGSWSKWSGGQRARLLRTVAAMIESEVEDLALIETLESGKPLAQARNEIKSAAEIWYYAATLAQHAYGDSHNGLGAAHLAMVLREPMGVVGIITPWNFPFLIVSQKLPFALAVGCTAVVKPSEMTPGTTTRLVQMVREAGAPDGVVSIVNGAGQVGGYLSAHPGTHMTSFTGSTAVGRKIMTAAAASLKKVTLELGGKNPQVVFPDADLAAAAEKIAFGAYFNQGECCNAGSRLLVHRDVADELTELVLAKTKEQKVGDPLDESTTIGSLISDQHLSVVDGYVRTGIDSGATVATGGSRIPSEHGRYFEPTVLTDVAPDARIAVEEIFGPVLSVVKFGDLAEAVKITNASGYGLSAGVWSSSMTNAFEYAKATRAGTVWINCWMEGFPEIPFGGVGASGIGRELGRGAVEDFTETKSVIIAIEPGSAGATMVAS